MRRDFPATASPTRQMVGTLQPVVRSSVVTYPAPPAQAEAYCEEGKGSHRRERKDRRPPSRQPSRIRSSVLAENGIVRVMTRFALAPNRFSAPSDEHGLLGGAGEEEVTDAAWLRNLGRRHQLRFESLFA